MRTNTEPVVVVGAGLAGLAAAASAARAGAPVVLLDTRSPGGRARTNRREGFLFNQGPHALYNAGPGRRALSRLGVVRRGHAPRIRGSLGFYRGHLAPLPLGARGLVAGGVVGKRSAAQFAGVLAHVGAGDPARWAGHSSREWIERFELRDDAAALTEALVRVTTYVADLDQFPADVAISQLRSGLLRGVTYLDGGWSSLVVGLVASATAAGAVIRRGVAATAMRGEPGAWLVVTTSGEEIPASSVVIAAGSPAAARNLLPVTPTWSDLGPEVTAACLDLGITLPGPRFVLGLDEPLYLSPHCPPGDLAPQGCGVVHVMRYGAREANRDREQLRALAGEAGVRDEDIVVDRFLARMVVVSAMPPIDRGLRGRPPVAPAEAPGIFLAGDWVGPEGWLADGALASGEKAGALAAEASSAGPAARGGRAA